ncbi:RING-type zinc-finger, LisH dimerization motif protein (macronuclear) [Tetrahymena thermophila SB210]|uniref:RING-type zinc-finger, LisH dimerization motif protein n=1 Tax=Tetrahymena thermophila (strain SB210) TaxID=312017 RepID=A4VD57_TETTS|nr:RING-type zinc-finger, LisH dimerization motif protein [Tetrahymena thermophila SB210]EDK31465.2 RING-type zinc-finger, LisH dimerization motif protein [Tetrahymena thermophila SB210]|eukprot:XP_001470963.2 RING-type zinc-finger, LisH dimerization motif protein [Tetrahymena thermophila SB210]
MNIKQYSEIEKAIYLFIYLLSRFQLKQFIISSKLIKSIQLFLQKKRKHQKLFSRLSNISSKYLYQIKVEEYSQMIENNELDLFCSSCQNMFDENNHLPRMLPECGHTFCNQCLVQILEKNDFIECPEDNIVSSRKEVVSFPKNYSLINIIRKKKKLSEYSSPLHTFEQETQSSEKGGSSRKNSIQLTSFNSSIRNSHEEDQTQTLQQKKKCKDHKKEKDIVCLDCRQAICSNCALFGEHKKHEVASEEDVIKNITERAETLLQVYEELEEKSALINTTHYKDVIHTHLISVQQSLQSQLNQQFQSIIRQIEEKKNKLYDEINNLIVQTEGGFYKILDLSKQNLLNEIEEWKKKAQDKLQNLCELSSKNEIMFDMLEVKNNQNLDIIDQGEEMLRQIIENNSIISEKVKMIQLQETKLEFDPSFQNSLNNFIKIKQIKDDKNIQNAKLQELLKQSELTYKQQIRLEFRKRSQYKKTKKYLDEFYNQTKKYNTHFNFGKNEQILEASEATELVQDKQEDDLIRRAMNRNNQDDDLNEEQLKESLLINQVSDANNIINFDELQQSQIIGNDFILKPHAHNQVQNDQKQHFTRVNSNFYMHNNDNCKKNNEEDLDDENLISQINNKDFLLSSMLSYHNLSLNDINLLEEQIHTHEVTGTADIKKSILLSLAKDTNLLNEDDDDKFLEESSKSQTDHRQILHIKEQAKFLNLIQEIFGNSIEIVDLSNMEIGDKGLEILAIALKENSSIKTLKLNKNKITDEGFIKLIDLVETNCKNIEEIYLQNNQITEKSLNKIQDLKKNTICKIKNIYLKDNSIADNKVIQGILSNENKLGIKIHF